MCRLDVLLLSLFLLEGLLFVVFCDSVMAIYRHTKCSLGYMQYVILGFMQNAIRDSCKMQFEIHARCNYIISRFMQDIISRFMQDTISGIMQDDDDIREM